MKFNRMSQLALVSAIGLLAASLLTGCQLVTIDFVYVAASAGSSSGSAGQIYTYAVDSQSGALRPQEAPVSSGGTHPVAMATTSNFYSLYVANQGNNSVVHFGVADTSVLTKMDQITTTLPPVALVVNRANTYLYVVSGTTSATLSEYSLSSNGNIGSLVAQQNLTLPSNPSDTIIPTAITVLPNNNSTAVDTVAVNDQAVYVTAYDQSAYNPGGATPSSANPGWIFGFAVGSSGALTPITGSPYEAGVKPTSITIDPTNRFIYATDFASNQLIGYTIQNGDVLDFMINGPFKTGNEPTSVSIAPQGRYVYLANSLSNSVSSYTINLATGTPSAEVFSNSTALFATETDPVALAIDPALGRFVYTVNHVGNSISGFFLNPNAGTLSPTDSTPYPTGADPTSLVIVPHGNHSLQAVTP